MLVCQAQLKRRFNRIHATGPRAKPRTCQRIDSMAGGTVVPVNSGQCSPHREINMIRALNIHRDAHRWRVCDERVRCMVRRNDDARSDRLFAQKIIENLLLNSLHYVATEKSDHGQIHPRIHQAERIASSYDAIEGRQLFKPTTNYPHLGMRAKLPASRVAEFLAAVYDNQPHGSDQFVRFSSGGAGMSIDGRTSPSCFAAW